MAGLGAYFILGSGINIVVFSALVRWTPVHEDMRCTVFGQILPPGVDPIEIAGVTLIMGVLMALLGGVWLARLGMRARREAHQSDAAQGQPSPQEVKAFFYAVLSFVLCPVPLLLRTLQTAEDPVLMARLGLEALHVFAGLWSVFRLAPYLSIAGLFLLIWLIAWVILRRVHAVSDKL